MSKKLGVIVNTVGKAPKPKAAAMVVPVENTGSMSTGDDQDPCRLPCQYANKKGKCRHPDPQTLRWFEAHHEGAEFLVGDGDPCLHARGPSEEAIAVFVASPASSTSASPAPALAPPVLISVSLKKPRGRPRRSPIDREEMVASIQAAIEGGKGYCDLDEETNSLALYKRIEGVFKELCSACPSEVPEIFVPDQTAEARKITRELCEMRPDKFPDIPGIPIQIVWHLKKWIQDGTERWMSSQAIPRGERERNDLIEEWRIVMHLPGWLACDSVHRAKTMSRALTIAQRKHDGKPVGPDIKRWLGSDEYFPQDSEADVAWEEALAKLELFSTESVLFVENREKVPVRVRRQVVSKSEEEGDL